MSPYDSPAYQMAVLRAKQINAKGGVLGRKIVIKKCDTQLKKQKECAAQLIGQGAVVGMVTCDVEYAAPSTQEFINHGMLALAPCIGTDQQGPKRFGAKGKLAFSLGSIAQDEGAAMAEYSISRKWKRAIVVKDNLLAYFRNVSDSFAQRFQQLGGKIVERESFTSFDKTIGNVASKVSRTKADVICFVTAFNDLPTFVSGVRSLGNKTPIINSWGGDGNYWWTKSPKVTNYYYVTYGSLYGDDPVKAVNSLVRQVKAASGGKLPATGSFVPGADLVDALVTAIKRTKSTNGAKLATAFEHFKGLKVTSGKITYSAKVHGGTHRAWRVMLVNNNKARFLRLWVTKKDANIG
jgi:branched-chain amino acid transport system substrate-binding protein